jgi:predicted nucleotidyltransferase
MPYLRKHFGVEQVALFGSFARNEATESSDIDVVISLSKPLGFDFIELADYLEGKLGHKVDLITKSTLELGITDPRRAHIAKDIQESLIYV